MNNGLGPASVRAFVALELDVALRERIRETMAALRKSLKGVRWVQPDALHLTLRFLGPSAPEALTRLRDDLGPVAARCPATRARVSGLGLFPERGCPRVLWLGISLAPEALALQRECERAAVAAGFPPEGRAFSPHLTLGRWRENVRQPELPPFDLGETLLETLVLFRSDLRPQGAVHTPLAVFPLG